MANFTQSAILNAFSAMLETTPFDKISVSSIVKACSISRNTFYYHYQDVYDLLDAWLEQELSAYSTDDRRPDWKENLTTLLNNCKKRKKLVYSISNSISRERLERYIFSTTDGAVENYIRQQAAGKSIPESRLVTIVNICRYSIMGYFLRFIWNNMKEDPDVMVDELGAVFDSILANFIAEYETK